MSILQRLKEIYRRDGLDFVISLYREFLGRDPDPQGMQTHMNLLQTGRSKFSVMKGIFSSNESRKLIEASGTENDVPRECTEVCAVLSPDYHGSRTNFRYLVVIPFINRLDLLYQALQSVKSFYGHIVVIDNSDKSILTEERDLFRYCTLYTPPVPLSFSQSMNMMHKMGRNLLCDVVIYMHVDAKAGISTPERMLQIIEDLELNKRKWGVVMTNYDTIAAYSMRASEKIGLWDTVLPNYFTDWDYYKRMKVLGYERIESGLTVTHYNGGSSSYKSDPEMEFMVRTTYPLYQQYFEAKWGPNQSYTTPFNR